MPTFIVDGRVRDAARVLLPEDAQVEVLDVTEDRPDSRYPVGPSPIGAISLSGKSAELKAALADGPLAQLGIVELDPSRPEAGSADVMRLLMGELQASRRQAGEARSVAAQLRSECIDLKTRLREIENLLYSLGNPQLSSALAWQPTGSMQVLASGSSIAQALPMNAVSLSAVDLWFPQVIMPEIDGLSVTVEDASGEVHSMQAVNPEMGLETGWVRFCLPEPLGGIGRDCRIRVTWTGSGELSIGLGQPVPDHRFRATLDVGVSPDETLALRVWQSLGGVRLPSCAPAFASPRAVGIREAEFVRPSVLPAPELFALPMTAGDHVSTAYWENEDAILVHPSRSGPACAIIRGVDLAGLSHVSALVTVGHVRAPNLNFAIGVAPHGVVDEDGFWQRRIGPWVTGLPARGWGQAHCVPVEPITGKADLLLAVSLSTDVPNDLSWGLFRGFRFGRFDPSVEISA